MDEHRVFKYAFARLCPHYIEKAEKKGRTKENADSAICWLTGYSAQALAKQIEAKKDLRAFFDEAPRRGGEGPDHGPDHGEDSSLLTCGMNPTALGSTPMLPERRWT